MRKVAIGVLSIFFLWYTLNVTGFSIGRFKLVVSCFVDEPIDVVGWGLLLVGMILFIWKAKVGQYVMAVLLFLFAFLQGSIYFRTPERIASYNNHFANQGTHYLIPPSPDFLIKDTWHTFLDVLILISLVTLTVYIVKELKKKKATSKQD